MQKPVIVRVLMADDWLAAFGIVFAQTFAAAAGMMGAPADPSKIALQFGEGPTDWAIRRGAAARMDLSCADADKAELARAWALLALDPKWREGRCIDAGNSRAPPFAALADAIAKDPSLVDDEAFCRRVAALRFLSQFGIGGPIQDVIDAAAMLGGTMQADSDELLDWARRLSRTTEMN